MASSTPDLPQPLDLSTRFSRTTKARAASSVKKFYKYFGLPGIGQLAGGKLPFLYNLDHCTPSYSALSTRFRQGEKSVVAHCPPCMT
jgi:hypothetical protein